MPRLLVLPDAPHLLDDVETQVFYAEEVSAEDLDDQHVAEGILDRLEFALRDSRASG